jgi:predicted nucleic-acid-binding protein
MGGQRMTILDTNAVLRYILNDNEQMSDIIEHTLTENDCFVPAEVVAEMVYVFDHVYKIPRKEISATILKFLQMKSVSCSDMLVVTTGLDTFATTKLDFVDCLLVGYSNIGHHIVTFDKKLKNKLYQQEK